MDAIISENGTWLVIHKKNGDMDKGYALTFVRGWFWNTIDAYKYISQIDIKRYFLENKGIFTEITKEEAILKYKEITEEVKIKQNKNYVYKKIYKNYK